MKELKSREQFKSFYREKDIVDTYDEERSRTVRKRVVRRLERHAAMKQICNVSRIFEGGVGTGYITEELLKRGMVYGIDTSDKMIGLVKTKFDKSRNLFLQKGSIFEIKLDESDFDVAISVRVLMHLDEVNISKALKQLSLVTKLDGTVIFDLPANSLIKRLIQYAKKRFVNNGSEVKNYIYSIDDINRIVSREESVIIEHIYAVDHLSVLLPFYLLSYFFESKSYEDFIYSLELKLLNLRIFNTKWFIVCKKIKMG